MRCFGPGLALLASFALAPSFALAQGAAGNGPCGSIPEMTADRATQFLGDPGSILGQYRDIVGGLAVTVRDLAIGRPETIGGMVTLANQASQDQLRAIGAGLGTAAAVCALSQPGTAQRIQEAVLATNKPEIVNAYTSIVGEVATEAVPELPPTGETTAGGSRGVQRANDQGAGGVVPTSPSGSFFSLLGAASRQSTTPLVAVSPSN